MKIENPLAFRYILKDDVYILNSDKAHFANNSVKQPITQTPAIVFNYLGGNKKNFLVIVHYSDTAFMNEKHLFALESTLKRLNFEMDDIAIFNIAGSHDRGFEVLVDFFKPENLLILGKSALPGGIETLSLNTITNMSNCKVLYTFSFDQMMESTESKKIFWEQMKQL